MDTSLDSLLERWGRMRQQGPLSQEALEQLRQGSPEALRQELQRAMTELQSFDDWLDTVAQGGQRTDPLAAEPTLPKRYQLLDKLGQGGMGVIHRALDRDLDREVAIKLLQERYSSNSPTALRFVDEARIMGQLQHPGIPAIHELGLLSDGRPFLAMKLVKGRTLAEQLEERADPKADLGRLLSIFEQICQAAGYAHARRVIHRDLKPSNVMIGAFGEVQVMDWGLAKILSSDGEALPPDKETREKVVPSTIIKTARTPDSETQAGSILGTPAYMSPEQAAGELAKLDRRTDVFALGAILCEILTGEPPYLGPDGEMVWMLAMRAQLADANDRLDRCGAAPEWVDLAKACLAIDPEARPKDAWQVAEIAGRIRADTEQRARQAEMERERAVVREAEARKRRRVWFVVAACLLLGLVASSIMAIQAHQARAEAEEAEKAEAEAHRLAQSHLEQAIKAIEQMLLEASEERLAHVPHAETLRRDLAQDARSFLDDLLKKESKNPDVRLATAKAYKQLGSIEQTLGDIPAAEKTFQRAIDLFQRLAVEYPLVPLYRDRLASTYYDLSVLYQQKRRTEEGLAFNSKVLELWNVLHENDPHHHAYRHGLGMAYLVRGWLSMDMNDARQAELSFHRSLEQFVALSSLDRDNPRYEQESARALHFLGWLHSDQNRLEKAREYYLKSMWQRELLVKQHGKTQYELDLGYTYNNMGVLHDRLGQFEEAAAFHRKGIAIFQKLAKDFPLIPEYKNMLGLLHNNLVRTMLQQDRPNQPCLPLLQEARTQLLAALEITPGHNGFRRNLGQTYRHLAEVHMRLGEVNASLMLIPEMLQWLPGQGDVHWHAASLYARAMDAAAKDERLSLPERQERLAALGGQAVQQLQEAQQLGYLQRDDLLQGKMFDALRSRTDFQEFVKKHAPMGAGADKP